MGTILRSYIAAQQEEARIALDAPLAALLRLQQSRQQNFEKIVCSLQALERVVTSVVNG
jgi:hypothetical protein